MIVIIIFILLCHLTNLILNLVRGSSSGIQKIFEACTSIIGIVASGLALLNCCFAIGLSFSFISFAIMFFLNTVRYGMKNGVIKPQFQYSVYGVSGLGVLLSIITSVLWYCI